MFSKANILGFFQANNLFVCKMQKSVVRCKFAWNYDEKDCTINFGFMVPFACTARLVLPYHADGKVVELESGIYEFSYHAFQLETR